MKAPEHVGILETLNVIGVHADYMKQFKEYLEEEGLPANEQRTQFILPVVRNLNGRKLKTVKLREGIDFKRNGPKPELGPPPEKLHKSRLVLDWYPRLQAMASARGFGTEEVSIREENHLRPDRHLPFLDLDEVYFELQRFKAERAWFNLNLSKQSIAQLLERHDWYTLYIPPEEMEFRSFDQVREWQEIATALLKKYADRYPKGIRNLEGRSDPKIAFHRTIKELESRLGDPLVTLSSFIVANTPYQQVKWWSDGMTKDDFHACNVLFQQDDRDSYIGALLSRIVEEV